ncbi:MAG: preprotein translocase subunit SecG [Terriglobia bacterium]|jgi:preprotein translocase subunit SecG
MMAVIQIIHILSSILLIGTVLLQGGENVDITAAFGGVSQAAFGPRGSVTLLAKITWGLAVVFIVTSVTLAIHASRSSSGSVLEHAPVKSAPVTPASPAPARPAPAAPAKK